MSDFPIEITDFVAERLQEIVEFLMKKGISKDDAINLILDTGEHFLFSVEIDPDFHIGVQE